MAGCGALESTHGIDINSNNDNSNHNDIMVWHS